MGLGMRLQDGATSGVECREEGDIEGRRYPEQGVWSRAASEVECREEDDIKRCHREAMLQVNAMRRYHEPTS